MSKEALSVEDTLKLALEEIKRVKAICLREAGIGLCNEVVIAKLEEALAQPEQDADRFCDANCTWSDHHPDCKYGKPEQEPVVGTKTWFEDGKVVTQYLHTSDIYTTPPQRTWVGLTDEEVEKLDCVKVMWQELDRVEIHGVKEFYRNIEAKLKEKNT